MAVNIQDYAGILVKSQLNLGIKIGIVSTSKMQQFCFLFIYIFFYNLGNMLRVRKTTREYPALLLLFLFDFTVRRSD